MELPASARRVPPFTSFELFVSQSTGILKTNNVKGGSRVTEATTRFTKLESLGFFNVTLE
jgi:hypothetical protein